MLLVSRRMKRPRATRPTTVNTPATAGVFWKNLQRSWWSLIRLSVDYDEEGGGGTDPCCLASLWGLLLMTAPPPAPVLVAGSVRVMVITFPPEVV